MDRITKQIACGIDNKYIQHFATMLKSLFINNQNDFFNIHIIYNKLSGSNYKRISEFVQENHAKPIFYKIDKKLLRNAPVPKNSHLSVATYLRILIPELLPRDISKVLYLDSDLVVLKSIDNLYGSEIKNFALAAIEDPGISDQYKYQLGMSPNKKYFNAGVMLLNLEYCRNFNLTKKAVEYIDLNRDKIKTADQDVLNGVLDGEWVPLEAVWNVQSAFFLNNKNKSYRLYNLPENFQYIKNNPSIIHYNESELKRPWMFGCTHPLKDEYYKYIKQTPWSNYKLTRPSLFNKTKEFIKLILKKIGLFYFIRGFLKDD
jgi:lipopolysaccharide biosynthesis glycosyltransferase